MRGALELEHSESRAGLAQVLTPLVQHEDPNDADPNSFLSALPCPRIGPSRRTRRGPQLRAQLT